MRGDRLAVFFLASVGGLVVSDTCIITNASRASLFSSRVHRIDRVQDFPPQVMQAYVPLSSGLFDVPGLANPGEPWQTECTIDPSGPPRRRLIFGGCSDSACFVYFEHGNNSEDLHFITFALRHDGTAEPRESLLFRSRLRTVEGAHELLATARTRAEAGWHERW
jgi:hypothetical protein